MPHRWDLSPAEAKQLQASLVHQLDLSWDGRPVDTVGGVDVSVKGGTSRAAIVILRFPDLEPLTAATAKLPLTFPYIPGLLSFREGPVILAAWEALELKPDLLLFDAQGTAHPRRFGLSAGLCLARTPDRPPSQRALHPSLHHPLPPA